jgi:hypothetical protein
MTAIQLNAEIFRELSIIAEDEGMMEKALKALRRITKSRTKKVKAESVAFDSLPELPDAIKSLQGIVSFTPEELNSDSRLAYLHSK